MPNVLLLKTWKANIGNEVIENGAKSLLYQSMPDMKIFESSAYEALVKYSKHQYSLSTAILRKFRKIWFERPDWYSNLVSPIHFMKNIDIAVLPGCVLDSYTLSRYMPFLLQLSRKRIPIIFLGAGGSNYSSKTQEYVYSVFEKIKPMALITRDSFAYNCYSDNPNVDHVYNGADCGFFISDWYDPPESDEDFIVFAFDKHSKKRMPIKRLISQYNEQKVIFTTHRPFNSVHYTITADIFARPFIKLSRLISHIYRNDLLGSDLNLLDDSSKIFFSDDIKDYLFFYKNAREVHTDRVHAAVSSLSYGTKTKLYITTPRASLFKNLDSSIDIQKQLTSIPKSMIEKKKYEIIKLLNEIISELNV